MGGKNRRSIVALCCVLLLVGCGGGAASFQAAAPTATGSSDYIYTPAAGNQADPFTISTVAPNPTPTVALAPTLTTETSVVVRRGESGRQEIALTFDAGDDRGNTAEILDILREYGIHATFGVTGLWAEANPDLIQRMAAEGHQIINHTWSHKSFTGESTSAEESILDSAGRERELLDTAALIEKLTGLDPSPYFRPPYGDYDRSVLEQAGQIGYGITLMWSCDTLGWSGRTVEEILFQCTTDMSAGDIVLMHVGSVSQDAEALPGMIEILKEQGFTLVTIDELLAP